MAQCVEIVKFIAEDLTETRHEMIKNILEDDFFSTLSKDDQITLIVANWNRVMITFLLTALKIQYLHDVNVVADRPPTTLMLCQNFRKALADDDCPIIDNILTELVQEVIKLELNENDLDDLIFLQLFDICEVTDNLNSDCAVLGAYWAYKHKVFYKPIQNVKILRLRRKIHLLSDQCQKLLFWDGNPTDMATWLRQALEQQ